MKKIFSGIGKILQLIFGLAFIVGGIDYLAKDSSSFLPVEAAVVSSAEKYYADESIPSYEINYEYQVDGNTYTGSYTVAVDQAAGDKVTVYYNPNSHSESYYTQHQTIAWGLTGLAFGLFAAGDVVWGAWKRRAAKKVEQAIPGQEPS